MFVGVGAGCRGNGVERSESLREMARHMSAPKRLFRTNRRVDGRTHTALSFLQCGVSCSRVRRSTVMQTAAEPVPDAPAAAIPRMAAGDARTTKQNGSAMPKNSNAAKVDVSYGAEMITVLEGLEPVRKRPGMYIGSTGSRGLHHMVYEVVDNAVDEALAGFCTEVSVILCENGAVTVRDNGRGIPVDVHQRTGKSALETVMTVLHAGGKFGQGGYKVSGGLHGVGISVVNALSSYVKVSVWRQNMEYSMEFAYGKPTSQLVVTALPADLDSGSGSNFQSDAPMRCGTQVTFLPDPKIFTSVTEFDFDMLAERLRQLAFLNGGLSITLKDERKPGNISNANASEPLEGDDETPAEQSRPNRADSGVAGKLPRTEIFMYEGGIREYSAYLCRNKTALHEEVIYMNETVNDVQVEMTLQWSADSYTDLVLGFANNIRTVDGGTHIDGFKTSLTRTFNSMARKLGKLKEKQANLSGEFIREGLTAVVSVKVPDPEFEGQTKTKLGNPEVRSIVEKVTSTCFADFVELSPQVLFKVYEKAMNAFDAAQAARNARELVRRKTVLESSTLPGKLADCSSREPAEAEIFIVEGDSAGGSAKQGRDRFFQAILPLRGKILNIEKAEDGRIYRNTEIQALISALGLGIRGEAFDVSQLRYHRIVILSDADVDGAHIRTLLLTFFFRYQRALLENGFIYIACPPLYKVTRKSGSKSGGGTFLFDEAELRAYLDKQANPATVTVQRFKGLGEMMPQQLWDTTMNPDSRRMKQVTVDDAAAADALFRLLMGDEVAPRREFIESHAASLDLDSIDF